MRGAFTEQVANPFAPEQPDETKRVYVFTDVEPFLSRHRLKHPELTGNVFDPEKQHLIETVLLRALNEWLSHPDEHTPADINTLRGMIRAASNYPPNHHTDEQLIQGLSTKQFDPFWEEVIQELRSSKVGDALEPIIREIEEAYQIRAAHLAHAPDPETEDRCYKDLEQLRPFRDRLYLRLVHPAFAEALGRRTIIQRPSTQRAA